MNLEQRTAALLAVVADYRAQRCAELLDPAHAQARALLTSALREARRRVRTAIGEERKRLAVAVAAAAAQLATERRLVTQRRAAERLALGWTALRAALQARWRDPATRQAWTEAHLARVHHVLQTADRAAGWTLTGPVDWPHGEQARVVQALRAHGAATVQCATDPLLAAGFRVQAGHNVLDATLDGLLADRAAVQGRLLQLIEEPE
ncbi:MAG: hypothetical protein U5L03_15535 [Burkholderiaceae bacterium]|nr:hypothetical protein [Burkholderiaceae bacterium]